MPLPTVAGSKELGNLLGKSIPLLLETDNINSHPRDFVLHNEDSFFSAIFPRSLSVRIVYSN